MTTSRLLVFSLAAVISLTAGTGAAQVATTTVAEALYQEGRDLMKEQRYEEACAKFAESQRLDPATGTLLNLAACHEAMGRLTTAWTEYHRATAAARRDGREDRVQYAQSRIAELEPRLSRLTIVLQAGVAVPDLRVELDGVDLGAAALGVPTPVDPGDHLVRASAPGKRPWSETITVAPDGARATLTIPALADAPEEAKPAAEALPSSTGVEGTTAGDAGVVETRPVPLSVWIAGGATVALAAASTVTGIVYLNKKNDFDAVNRSTVGDETKRDASDDAERIGVVNTALWAGTAVGALVTVGLYLTRPTERAAPAAVEPWLGPGFAGVGLRGRL